MKIPEGITIEHLIPLIALVPAEHLKNTIKRIKNGDDDKCQSTQ